MAGFGGQRLMQVDANDIVEFEFIGNGAVTHVQRVRRRRSHSDQLNLSPAAFTSAMFCSISFPIMASNSFGVSGIGSIPCGLNFSMTAGSRSTFIVSSYSRSTMLREVFAGTSRPFQ